MNKSAFDATHCSLSESCGCTGLGLNIVRSLHAGEAQPCRCESSPPRFQHLAFSCGVLCMAARLWIQLHGRLLGHSVCLKPPDPIGPLLGVGLPTVTMLLVQPMELPKPV
eukprot:1583612-Amphidinium_carterae.2